MEINSNLFSSESKKGTANPNIPYKSAVGALIYLTQATRPDLAYAVSSVSRFNSNYDTSHWEAVKRILRYLQKTKDLCLQYSQDKNSNLIGYCDASHGCDGHDARSVSGYIFIMQGGAVSWNSRRQQTVALSSTEAEYLSLTAAAQEAIWLKNITVELEIQPRKSYLL
ncbi:secreted RxLR effector protein 161-like [Nasonia vitripennis]|uniref:Retrovirus-related Pol polyprotein from transposon TNT 1-94 n=1 Tax=Nasonia vitripennis TaxID=7425 RepID=A0A7M7T650_NASVI|nr:secreted RxLR effector protein 161-like [Nasonia vitripennis]